MTNDGMIHALELAMVVTGKKSNHARETLRNLDQLLFESKKFIIRSSSRFVTLKHAIELIMVLPCTIAKQTRQNLADVITRYIAKDATPVEEINANAASVNPISEQLEEKRKSRRALEDLPISESQLELQRGQLELEKGRIELDLFKVQAPVNLIIHCMTTIETMCGGLDARDKKRYKAMLNISADTIAKRLAITNADKYEDEAAYFPTPTSISDIVNSMEISGLKNTDYQQIDKIAKRMYVYSHDGKSPSQRSQHASSGQRFNVNDYYLETDEQMLKDAVNEFMDKHSKV